jgi:hypothetical protein
MKSFQNELKFFHDLLVNRENFSIARFGDGEMIAMRGQTISSGCGEWNTNGPEPQYELARYLLKQSFNYIDPGYYVGIVCPCCQGIDNFNKMKIESGQPDSQLTFANVFVNSNYKEFINNFIPIFRERRILLVANERSNIHNLPFSGKFIGVGYNAWVNNLNVIETIKSMNLKDHIILTACGPLGKILVHQLWVHDKSNTYLDIGSTLHPWLGSDLNIRGYYQTNSFHSKLTCTWGN